MKLYMKQKVFSIGDKFTIKGESGLDKYYVAGEVFSMGKKLHLYDVQGNELAFVKQRLMTFLPKFEVYYQGQMVVEIVKEFTFFKHRYSLNGTDWTVDGDMFAHDYRIQSSTGTVAHIYKEWFTWGDSYAIEIFDEVDEILITATVLAIDAVLAQNN